MMTSDYELISETDDTYMVKMQNGPIQFNHKNMLQCLHFLSACANKQVCELDNHEREFYDRVIETIQLLSHTQASRDLIDKDIQKIFNKDYPKNTVGYHLLHVQ